MLRKKEQGFTLIGAAILAAILGASIAVYGIINYYVGKAKAKSESKVSAIDSENALVELVATKFRAQGCSTSSPDLSTFRNGFRDKIAGAVFSDNTVNFSLVAEGNRLNQSNGSPAWMTAAIDSCNGADSPKFPLNNGQPGVYIFCIRTGKAADDQGSFLPTKSSTSFLESDLSFVQFRLELTSQAVPQDQKVMGTALTCTQWNGVPLQEQQLKISYRILWKKPQGNPQEVFSHLGSKILNLAELRGT